jgi:Mn-dependent DtxR family transcriptional regulator
MSSAPLTETEASFLLALADADAASAPAPADPSDLARAAGVNLAAAHEGLYGLRVRGLVDAEALTLTEAGRSATRVLQSPEHAAQVLAGRVLKLDERHRDAEAARLAAIMSPVLARSLVAWVAE